MSSLEVADSECQIGVERMLDSQAMMNSNRHISGTTPPCAALIVGLSCFAAALLALVVTADTSPTNYTSSRLFGLWRGRSIAICLLLTLLGIGFTLAFWSRVHLLSYVSIFVATLGTVGALEVLGFSGVIDWKRLLSPSNDRLEALGAKRIPYLDVRGTTYQDTAKIWSLPTTPLEFHYRTDRYGFRNHMDRPTAEVVIVGDSMVVGALVPAEKTVSSLLEQFSGMTVMQAALIGLAPQEQHEIFWSAKIDIQERNIIQFIFEGNDLLDSHILGMRKAKAQLPSSDRGTLINLIWHKLIRATSSGAGTHGLRVCTIKGQLYTFLWGQQSFVGLEEEIANVTESLERFAMQIRSAGGRYSVVFVPKKLRVLAHICTFPPTSEISDPAKFIGPLRDEIAAWSRRAGIAMLDLTDHLIKGAESGSIPWFWGDSHWNETGHEIAARTIGEWPELRYHRK